MQSPILSVILATHTPQGIMRVENMQLPRVAGVEYVVSWQAHANTPIPAGLFKRDDIKIVRCDKTGISRNRNNALDHANGQICLNADDDLTYTAEQLSQVIDTFKNDPSLDFALFRYSAPFAKKYPEKKTSIHSLPRHHHVTTFEIAFRHETSLRNPHLRFNRHFGPGAPVLTAGEDEVFLMAAKRLGLNGYFFPITITHHEGIPTGRRPITDNGVLRTTGALIALSHIVTFPPRIVINAWRIHKRGRTPFLKALWHMFHGAGYAVATKQVRQSVRF